MRFIRKRRSREDVIKIKEPLGINGQRVPLLYFPLLEENGLVKHCFTTREGGVSQEIFRSLNLSFTRGDRDEDVMENYKILASAMGVELDRFVLADQTHTTNVRVCHRNRCRQRSDETDGLSGCRWIDHERSGIGAVYFFRRLYTIVFCGSGT